MLCLKVYRKANPGLAVRIYLLVYNNSCEEAKYLAGVRREKDSFERLIRERGVRLLSCGMDRLGFVHLLDGLNFSILSSQCSTLSWSNADQTMQNP